MPRLIDADEIKKREKDVVLANGAKHRCFDTTMLYELPTVDAVEVVRCRDCKYRFDGEHVHNCCEQLMEKSGWVTEIPVDDNWYCADGEKRKDGTKTD